MTDLMRHSVPQRPAIFVSDEDDAQRILRELERHVALIRIWQASPDSTERHEPVSRNVPPDFVCALTVAVGAIVAILAFLNLLKVGAALACAGMMLVGLVVTRRTRFGVLALCWTVGVAIGVVVAMLS